MGGYFGELRTFKSTCTGCALGLTPPAESARFTSTLDNERNGINRLLRVISVVRDIMIRYDGCVGSFLTMVNLASVLCGRYEVSLWRSKMALCELEQSQIAPLREISDLIAADAFPQAIAQMAQSFIITHGMSPRTAGLFATQQRWLLCHAILAYHFRKDQNGQSVLKRSIFGNLALRHGIASRNTAYSFFDEALTYGIIQLVEHDSDGGAEAFVPSRSALSILIEWYAVHFQALDLIDGGNRYAQLVARPDDMLARVQPAVADALLSDATMRAPEPLYGIFAWVDMGGFLMDRLIAGMDTAQPNAQERIPTDILSISHLAQSFGLSRAHTSRKLAAAEAAGGIGWTGRRGRSRIWISRSFYDQYARAQARKLLILDKAFEEAVTAAGADAQPA